MQLKPSPENIIDGDEKDVRREIDLVIILMIYDCLLGESNLSRGLLKRKRLDPGTIGRISAGARRLPATSVDSAWAQSVWCGAQPTAWEASNDTHTWMGMGALPH